MTIVKSTQIKSKPIASASKKPDTKKAIILRLLGRKSGANIKDLCKGTGWQPHSMRGFLSGTLRKKMGLSIETFTTKSGRRSYRLVGKATS